MSEWTRLPALEGRGNPCANCPPIEKMLDLDRHIAVGFGAAGLSRDGETVWDECQLGEDASYEDCLTVKQAEEMAALNPDHDWRIYLHGPMHGEVYQRHGPNVWVLVQKDEGFA